MPSRNLIVVAEDDRDLRETLTDLLEQDGLRTIGVANGHSLVSCVAESLLHPEEFGRISLIIVDVSMPGISGLEAMARVRRCQVNTPLVIITANPSLRIQHVAERLGAAAIVKKPFGYAQLASWVRRLTSGSGTFTRATLSERRASGKAR
jgi:DNA-binding response OmpR family regulator